MCSISPVVKQILAVLCCNIMAYSFGFSNFWTAANLLELKSVNSTFPTGPLSQQESAIVVAILNLGGLLGNFIILPLSEIIGIKQTLHSLGLVMILSTILTISATHVYYLYFARILIGLVAGGVVVGIPALVNDISFDNVRGLLNSIYDCANNLGIISAFILGNFLPCMTQAKLQLIPPIIFTIALFFLPESPEFWIHRNKVKRANKAHRFYKGTIAVFNKPTKLEFIPIQQTDKDLNIESATENNENSNESNPSVTFSDFCTPHARQSLFISFTMITLAYLTGTITILNYITAIFQETGSALSEKQSAVLISVTQITGNFVFLNIVERFNRKTLYIGSALSTTVLFFLFGAYGYFGIKNLGYEWIPPLCMACIIFSSCMGLLSIPYAVTSEIFPKKIRKTCLSFAISLLWIILFILGYLFPPIVASFGIFNSMFALGCVCLLNALFGYFFVIETRGKSFREIEVLMRK